MTRAEHAVNLAIDLLTAFDRPRVLECFGYFQLCPSGLSPTDTIRARSAGTTTTVRRTFSGEGRMTELRLCRYCGLYRSAFRMLVCVSTSKDVATSNELVKLVVVLMAPVVALRRDGRCHED
jgi:hypothetical protein